ncbi:MAG: endo-1,4-beta-xylanase, partial [Armatimonadetes bacterium]|nr:endo-1,4-beta-xylanase [Armatimonadota bacterium]
LFQQGVAVLPRLLFTITLMFMVSGHLLANRVYDESPFGINGLKLMHARHDPNIWENASKTAQLMRDAGIRWDRLELWWSTIEPQKGRFDWTFADKVAEFYKQQKINAMVILCYCSAWSNGKPPTDAEERSRYANYVYQVVSRYKGTYKVWEIWNEPNIPTFWNEPNVGHYTLLLKEAYKAAKRADPKCVVLAGCTSGADLGFIKGISEHGGWEYCDGISIHPYSMSGGPVPQQLDRILRITRESISRIGKPKPIWITEIGWTTHTPTLDHPQAVYLFQSYVIALANGVEKLFWFDLVDWAEKWGIVRNIDPRDLKPAYRAYQTLTRNIDGATFDGYMKMPRGVSCYVFKPKQELQGGYRASEERLAILWANDDQKHEVELPVDASSKVWDIMGNRVAFEARRVRVGITPILVRLPKTRIASLVSKNYNPWIGQEGRNLLTNGALDDVHGSHPWCWILGRFDGSAKNGKLAISSEGRSGSACVSISDSKGLAVWEACMVPVMSGKRYKLSAWVRAQNATGRNCVAMLWYSGNMWTYQGEVRSESITGTRDWTKVTVSGLAPKDSTFVRVNLMSEDNSGAVWFDDITLTEQ